MTPERWRTIEELFHEVLARPAEERDAFLTKACPNDGPLRRELESLIAHYGQATGFFEASLPQITAELLGERQAPLVEGQMVAHYEVIAPLGAGAMGEVYLAHDTTLARNVALKILPSGFISDPAGSVRFEQEARAASTLNHPNILTIFEIGQSDGIRFMATEFVDGQTLRQRMTTGRMSILEALEVGCQVAHALEAAHHAGIVHRDIKPANIMLRRDGYLKVLDFGLAKLIERRAPRDYDQHDRTAPIDRTSEPGLVVGTPHYMSPEQARGEEVDARSDVFSLGVVLFEMITGHLPFDGASTRDVIDAILTGDPLSLDRIESEIPKDLREILRKTLCKDRAGRYQSSSALSTDLQRIKHNLEYREANAQVKLEDSPTAAKKYRRIATIGLLPLLICSVSLAILISKRSTETGELTGQVKIPAISPEAYEAYLRGRFYWNKKSLQGYDKALASYEKALRIRPQYAAAYAGIASCYNFLGMGMGSLSAIEAAQKAKIAARRALELDANLPEAHAALAFTLHRYDWKWGEAEKEYKRAIQLDPHQAIFHVWYAELLRGLGRKEEAQLELRLSHQTDPPSSVETGRAIAGSYFDARKYDEAIAYYHRAVESETDPDTFRLRMDLAGYCLDNGRFDEAVSEYQKVLGLFGPNDYPLARLGLTYARSGRLSSAEEIIRQLEKGGKPGYVSYAVAEIQAALGRTDECVKWLNKAYQERAPQMVVCNREAVFASLRHDPRFRDLIRAVGLPANDSKQ